MSVTRIRLRQDSRVTYEVDYTREEVIDMLFDSGDFDRDFLNGLPNERLGQMLADRAEDEDDANLYDRLADDAGDYIEADPDGWEFDGTFEAVR